VSKSRIAIVSDVVDAHADVVIGKLMASKHVPIRLNSSDIPLGVRLCAGNDRSSWRATLQVNSNGRKVDLEDVTAIWWRKPRRLGFPTEMPERARHFATDEVKHAFNGILATLDCYWVSRPERIKRAGYKVEQLHRAAEQGFDVPNTIVTNDPDAALDFYDRHNGDIVYKVLTDPYLGAITMSSHATSEALEPIMVTTTPVLPEQRDLLGDVVLSPCLFQEHVPKRCEYRVTVIADAVFVARIDSQASERGRVDWRNDYSAAVPYSAARLPDDIVDRCVAFVRSYGLEFSALDLIHTPDDRYVFLENNPNGQFLFIEERVPSLRMADALVSALVAGKAAAHAA
jgi:glutathione synthase/RimK-type ligase-like ATP-grasp enzyme